MIDRKNILIILIILIAYATGIFTIEVIKLLPEPKITIEKSFMDEIVSWRHDRVQLEVPYSSSIEINKEIANSYGFDGARLDLKLYILKYQLEPYGNRSRYVVEFQVTGNARLSYKEGFIHSMILNFSRTDAYATLYIYSGGTFWEPELYNLRMDEIQKRATYEQEAYIKTSGLNQPKNGLLRIPFITWSFVDNNDKDHWITTSLDIVYFNGTIYERTIVPIRLGMTVDANNDVSSAETIVPGKYEAYLGLGDNEDYYKIEVEKSKQIIRVYMNPPWGADFNLELIDSTMEILASSKKGSFIPKDIFYQFSTPGFYYIKVVRNNGGGIYSLNIRLETPLLT